MKVKWMQNIIIAVSSSKHQKAFGKINIPFLCLKDWSKTEQNQLFVQL